MVTPEPWFEHQIRAFELMPLEGEDHQVGPSVPPPLDQGSQGSLAYVRRGNPRKRDRLRN